ncbi:Protein yippee-like [Platanthera zijinensis]|uniref:Protein yippee-like n=1 Tax=Platanthera zijinensis TaxID=2320716 RepID=A0AAP0BZH7_9ASPA
MGRIFTVELDGRIYRCRFCRTHLAVAEDLVSRPVKNWYWYNDEQKQQIKIKLALKFPPLKYHSHVRFNEPRANEEEKFLSLFRRSDPTIPCTSPQPYSSRLTSFISYESIASLALGSRRPSPLVPPFSTTPSSNMSTCYRSSTISPVFFQGATCTIIFFSGLRRPTLFHLLAIVAGRLVVSINSRSNSSTGSPFTVALFLFQLIMLVSA